MPPERVSARYNRASPLTLRATHQIYRHLMGQLMSNGDTRYLDRRDRYRRSESEREREREMVLSGLVEWNEQKEARITFDPLVHLSYV